MPLLKTQRGGGLEKRAANKEGKTNTLRKTPQEEFQDVCLPPGSSVGQATPLPFAS